MIKKNLNQLKKHLSIRSFLSFIPLLIIILYYVTKQTLSHDNMIFLTLSFLTNLITNLIITLSLITAHTELAIIQILYLIKENKKKGTKSNA